MMKLSKVTRRHLERAFRCLSKQASDAAVASCGPDEMAGDRDSVMIAILDETQDRSWDYEQPASHACHA